ncbi:hypothetical protein FB471_1592 [Amycolatopsis cihanbeyliensis]|uniref:Uncharacterized protein n=2 Tax=Amycolatopsis cihanbeyliensis TaxID=1128664 RepID=A0A542DFN2_AMYCI|nr:hypothetical protein FB471_1592 [Amycolatopsis cihanbeyliensis]
MSHVSSRTLTDSGEFGYTWGMQDRSHHWDSEPSNVPVPPDRDIGGGTGDVPEPVNKDEVKHAEDLSEDEVTPEPPD